MFKLIKLIIAVAAALYVASFIYVISFSWRSSIPTHADAVLVLGAKVNLDNSPSEPLYNRTMEAVAMYQQKRADYIITTGGQGLGYLPEATLAKRIAEQHGVPRNKIISETDSHNTLQNIQDIQIVAAKYKIKSVIIVSDRFHVARGVFVAKHFGFDPVYWDYPDSGYYKTSLLLWDYAREAAALIYYIPTVLLTQTQ